MPLQPHFFERCAVQQQIDRSPERGYEYVMGSYTHQYIKNHPPLELPIPDTDLCLRGTEAIIAHRIRMARQLAPDQTAMAVDVGSGVGVSWLRLGAYYKKEIADEKVVLLAPNLRHGPVDFLKHASRKEELQAEVTEAITLYETYGNYVRYGLDKFVRSPHRGVIALIHERLSLTAWCKIPETRVVNLGRLISRAGIYMVDTLGILGVNGLPEDENLARIERHERSIGVAAAQAYLVRGEGLRFTNLVETGPLAGQPLNYRIFCGPDAPEVGTGKESASGVQYL